MDDFCLVFLLLPLLASVQGVNGSDSHCQAISIDFCKDMPYNQTIMPTLLGHKNQEEVGRDLENFNCVPKKKCSPYLKLFLCYLYVPVCTILESPIPPCRSVCERAKLNSADLMKPFAWPENLRCEQFPVHELCLGPLDPTEPPTITTAAPAETQTVAPNRSGPPGAKLEKEDSSLQMTAP